MLHSLPVKNEHVVAPSHCYSTHVQSFILMSNKGGVGKSTLAFHLATECALANPNDKILVVDLCHQSNLSNMLTGSNSLVCATVFDFTKKRADSINTSYKKQKGDIPLENLKDYLIKPCETNNNIPNNLWLLHGSNEIAKGAVLLENVANSAGITMKQSERWELVHTMLRKAIKGYTEQRIGNEKFFIFIDTHSIFDIYSAIGLFSADKIIVPINSKDVYSLEFKSILGNIHTNSTIDNSLPKNAFEMGIPLPRVSLIISNLMSNNKFSDLYTSAMSLIKKTSFEVFSSNPQLFDEAPFTNISKNQHELANRFQCNVEDLTPLRIGSQQGIPVSKLQPKKYGEVDVIQMHQQMATNRIKLLLGKLHDPVGVFDENVCTVDEPASALEPQPATGIIEKNSNTMNGNTSSVVIEKITQVSEREQPKRTRQLLDDDNDENTTVNNEPPLKQLKPLNNGIFENESLQRSFIVKLKKANPKISTDYNLFNDFDESLTTRDRDEFADNVFDLFNAELFDNQLAGYCLNWSERLEGNKIRYDENKITFPSRTIVNKTRVIQQLVSIMVRIVRPKSYAKSPKLRLEHEQKYAVLLKEKFGIVCRNDC